MRVSTLNHGLYIYLERFSEEGSVSLSIAALEYTKNENTIEYVRLDRMLKASSSMFSAIHLLEAIRLYDGLAAGEYQRI